MFRHKLKECPGVLTAASDFACARTLLWIKADSISAALPSAPVVCAPDHPRRQDVPAETHTSTARDRNEQQQRQQPASSSSPRKEAVASNSQSPEQAVLQEACEAVPRLEQPVGSPVERSVKASKQTARKRQDHPLTPLASPHTKAVATCSSGAAGSQQAASTQLRNGDVCHSRNSGGKRKRHDQERPGSESPSSPSLDLHLASTPQPQQQQQQGRLRTDNNALQQSQQPNRTQHPLAIPVHPQHAGVNTASAGPSNQHLPAWNRPLVRDLAAHAKVEALRAKYLARTKVLKHAGQVRFQHRAAAIMAALQDFLREILRLLPHHCNRATMMLSAR